jgi:hypothetical protein
MDKGITRPWPAQLDARDGEFQRDAMARHISDIAVVGGPVSIAPQGERAAVSLLGWIAMAFLFGAIVLFLVAIR